MKTPQKVKIDHSDCIRFRHAAATCQACFDACQAGAIDRVDDQPWVRNNRCTGCGACVSQCPLGAISLEGKPLLLIDVMRQAHGAHSIQFACSHAQADQAIRCQCLDEIDISELMAAAGEGVHSIELISGKCKNCELRTHTSAIAQRLEDVRRLVRSCGSELSVVLKEAPDASKALQSLGRRAAFRSLFTRVEQAVDEETPPEVDAAFYCNPLASEHRQKPVRKTLLLKNAITALATRKEKSLIDAPSDFRLPVISTEDCARCYLCACACPTGALKKVAMQDGSAIVRTNSLCSECGLCQDVCYKHALTLGPVTLAEAIRSTPQTLISSGTAQTDIAPEDDVWEKKMAGMFDGIPVYRT